MQDKTLSCPICYYEKAYILNIDSNEQTLEIKCIKCSQNYSYIITQEAITKTIPNLSQDDRNKISLYINNTSSISKSKIKISGEYDNTNFIQIKNIIN